MEPRKKIIVELRNLFIETDQLVSDIVHTVNNYNDNGEKIAQALPTITTERSEIGCYDNIVYFTFIISSNSFTKSFYNKINECQNVQLYPLYNFKENLYPEKYSDYSLLLENIMKEKYLQVNFNYPAQEVPPLFKEYQKLVKLFDGVCVINQMAEEWRSKIGILPDE